MECNCCNSCEVEIENGEKILKPWPARFVLRIRNLFSCIKGPRTKDKKVENKEMVPDS